MAERQKIIERFTFQREGCKDKDREELGLDPELYLRVIEGELGRGGKVTLNRTIYPTVNYIEQCAKMDERAKSSFVGGKRGHRGFFGGAAEFEYPVQFLSVENTQENDGSSLATGCMAFLNTAAGRDVLTLYDAGMPIGVSSEGYGYLEPVTIDGDSPYYAANKDFEGQEVYEVQDFELVTFDLVETPAAGTFLESSDPNVKAALSRFRSLLEKNMPKEKQEGQASAVEPTVEAPVATEESVETPEIDVDAKIAEALAEAEKDFEARLEAAVAQAHKQNPFADVSEEMTAKLLSIAEAFSTPEQVEDAIEKSAEEKMAEKVAELEALLESVTAEREELLAEKAEQARKEAEEAAIVEATQELDHGEYVEAQIRSLIESGVSLTPEQIAEQASKISKGFAAVAGLVSRPAGKVQTEAADEDVDNDSPAPAAVNEVAGGVVNYGVLFPSKK